MTNLDKELEALNKITNMQKNLLGSIYGDFFSSSSSTSGSTSGTSNVTGNTVKEKDPEKLEQEKKIGEAAIHLETPSTMLTQHLAKPRTFLLRTLISRLPHQKQRRNLRNLKRIRWSPSISL